MASSKRQLEKRIEELDDEVEEQAEQIQSLEHVCLLIECLIHPSLSLIRLLVPDT